MALSIQNIRTSPKQYFRQDACLRLALPKPLEWPVVQRIVTASLQKERRVSKVIKALELE
jgi:hypothetical protein